MEIVSWTSSHWMVFHQSLGLDTMCPSAASRTMGCVPHWSVMSSKCSCIESCGSTFSIKVAMGYSGIERRMAHSMSTMCCKSDPSCPWRPGGLSRILEWSLQGGAVVMSIFVPGIACPRIVSTSSGMSTFHTSPMNVWLMLNVCPKCCMHAGSVSHQKVWSACVLSFCRASDAVPIPVKNERCITGGWL